MTAVPRLLVLETSSRAGWVAVAAGPELLASRRLDEARRHARDLAPAVSALLTERGWRPADLDGVVVGRGPGSYTGLRVGLMSAKTLAYATGCALLAVDTFPALATQVPPDVARVDVLADAQQESVYAQPFARDGGSWRPLADLAVRPFADWLLGRDAAAWVTGPGLHRWAERVPGGERVVGAVAWDPTPEALLRIGLERYLSGVRDDPFSTEPLYLRPSSAEEQWRRRESGRSG